jgi:hypothetical protein
VYKRQVSPEETAEIELSQQRREAVRELREVLGDQATVSSSDGNIVITPTNRRALLRIAGDPEQRERLNEIIAELPEGMQVLIGETNVRGEDGSISEEALRQALSSVRPTGPRPGPGSSGTGAGGRARSAILGGVRS